jgi:hypothetical protein
MAVEEDGTGDLRIVKHLVGNGGRVTPQLPLGFYVVVYRILYWCFLGFTITGRNGFRGVSLASS